MKKLVIFDCDGVLVDSEALSLQALVTCLNDQGIPWKAEQFDPRKFKGAKLASILNGVENDSQTKLPVDFEGIYRKKMDELFSTGLRAVEGVAEALAGIPYPKCVASSGPFEKIRRSLELTGLAGWFDGRLFSSYAVNSWKPEPGLFLHAAREMEADPSDCIVVEDAVLGVQAAVSAGMKPFGFAADGETGEFIKYGASPFSSMRELPAMIKNHFADS